MGTWTFLTTLSKNGFWGVGKKYEEMKESNLDSPFKKFCHKVRKEMGGNLRGA